MKNDFIYDIMRSEEIREYYRKNVELNTEEQICVILNSYNSLSDKLALLNKLYNNDINKKEVKELITLCELINIIYESPEKFFGNNCQIIYSLHELELECNINNNSNINNVFKIYSSYVDYFNNIEKIFEEMRIDSNVVMYEIDVIVLYDNGEFISPIEFFCSNINGTFVPFYCVFDREIFDKYNLSNAIQLYESKSTGISHRGLPFENGCRVKFQVPGMKEPFYGNIYNDKDLNGCWYNFVYTDGTVNLPKHYEDFLDMSYCNLDLTSKYAVFDWLERA